MIKAKRLPETSPQLIFCSEWVETTWNNATKAYYEDLGYEFTGVQNRLKVKVDDLHAGSGINVCVTCPNCLKDRQVQYRSIAKCGHTYCKGCAKIKDLRGMSFYNLTILDLYDKDIWYALCECGNHTTVTTKYLSRKANHSCGCLSIEATRQNGYNNIIDITGKKFNRLKVLKYVGESKWLCICDCGNKTVVGTGHLKNGTTSCGCYHKEIVSGSNSHLWNPNLTNKDREHNRGLPENKKWTQEVLRRDNYTCVSCGDSPSNQLEAHHLYDYSTYKNLRYDIDNGATLCKRCHYDFHYNFMGSTKASCTKNDFIEWLAILHLTS